MSHFLAAFSRVAVAAFCVAAVTTVCRAQAAVAPAPQAGYGQTLADSRNLFAGGDSASATHLLFSSNASKPGTGDWSLESGVKLLHLAATFVNCHDRANARAVAAQGIAMLTNAEAQLVKEGRQSSAARAQELIGTIEECVLHDDAAALAAYQKALTHDPSSPGAANASARLGHK